MTSLGLRKADLELLARARLAEAVQLLDARHFCGAYYLGGYSIELGLKATIAGKFQAEIIPDRRYVDQIYSHDLAKLVKLAELEPERLERVQKDADFAENWTYVVQWSEQARYAMIDGEEASAFIEALRDPNHGVFEWIRKFW